MTVEELYRTIADQKPPVIYLSGKTSTGKSTFGRRLRDDLGYRVIELEAVLMDVIQRHDFDERATFRKVFRDSTDSEEKRVYLAATDHLITDAVRSQHPVVIEGAVANAKTLARILSSAPRAPFIYFHPRNIESYIRNITHRFMHSGKNSYNGLPPTLWRFIDAKEFENFCQTRELTDSLRDSIRQFAVAAQQDSLTRLKDYQQRFQDIRVVEVT